MKVVVTGSRDFETSFVVEAFLEGLLAMAGLQEGMSLAHGACPTGADQIADRWARDREGVRVKRFPAEWSEHGKAAGPRRNREMLKAVDPDVVLAFLKRDAKNAGTKNCVTQARTLNYEVVEVWA